MSTASLIPPLEILMPAIREEEERRVPRFLELPPMEKQGKCRYVLQHHWRAKRSVHWNFRFEVDGHLNGVTILDNPPVPADVESNEQARKYSMTLPVNFQPVPGMGGKKCRVVAKARQPKEWLFWKEEYGPCGILPFDVLWKYDVGTSYEVVAEPDKMIVKMDTGDVFEVKPGTVGATRYGAGRFVIVDKGTLTFGAQKVWYNEWFLESFRKGKGKHSFYQIRVNMRAVRQPRMDPETKRPIPGKFEIVWDIWVPKAQDPYAVSKRARDEGWYPPKGFIPIPRYWIKANKEKFEEWLRRAREYWRERKELMKAVVPYKLFQMSWKGQRVIRDIPVFHWYFALKFGKRVRYWLLRDNPLRVQPTVATYEGLMPLKYWKGDAILKPGEFVHPKKRINAEWRVLDAGKAFVKAERVRGEEHLLLELDGKMKGIWRLEQEERVSPVYSLWMEEVKKIESGTFVLHLHSWEGGRHYDIRIDKGLKYLEEWSLESNPINYRIGQREETNLKKCYDKSWMEAEGRKRVGRVWTEVKILDRGEVEFIEDAEHFKSFRFRGEKLKGYFTLKWDGEKWWFERSRLPGMKKELKYEEKATFIRVHLHDIRDFSACESPEKVKRYKIPPLPEGVEPNICIYPRAGKIHGAKIQALTFQKPGWDLERVKRFDFKPYVEWSGVHIRG